MSSCFQGQHALCRTDLTLYVPCSFVYVQNTMTPERMSHALEISALVLGSLLSPLQDMQSAGSLHLAQARLIAASAGPWKLAGILDLHSQCFACDRRWASGPRTRGHLHPQAQEERGPPRRTERPAALEPAPRRLPLALLTPLGTTQYVLFCLINHRWVMAAVPPGP